MTAPDLGEITVEIRANLLLMGINRPHKYNGFTPEMFDQLTAAFEKLEADADLRAGVLFAHGDHFTAGLDLPRFADRFGSGSEDFAGAGSDQLDPFNRWGKRRTKPIVTAIQGITFTAGIELMLATDIVIAAENCRLSQLEPKRGLMACGGATYRFVERAGWGNAMRLLLTGMEFDVQEAYRCGLVQEVVPAGEQVDRAIAIATEIAEGAPLAVQATLSNAMTYALKGEQACAAEFLEISARMAASDDFAEGVQSFKERRAAVFKGK